MVSAWVTPFVAVTVKVTEWVAESAPEFEHPIGIRIAKPISAIVRSLYLIVFPSTPKPSRCLVVGTAESRHKVGQILL
jgi:hypothetical protein